MKKAYAITVLILAASSSSREIKEVSLDNFDFDCNSPINDADRYKHSEKG